MKPLNARLLIAALGAALLPACGSSSGGSAATPPSTAAATATPAAATPTPAATPSIPSSCRAIAPGVGTEQGCHQEASDFLKAVTEAVSIAQNSVVVDPDTKESYVLVQDGLIQSPNAYVKIISDTLDRQGLCAVYDGEEINVRNTNAYDEHFDVITSKGGSWIKYMSTCSPALPLPVLIAPPVQDPECKLAPSRSSYCDRLGATYDADMNASLDELIAQDRALAQPLIFDFTQKAPASDNGWKVVDPARYFSELAKKLRAKGYCSVRGGEDELWIKKGTNRLSEHWDLLLAEGYSLRLLATVCRDAAF